MVLEDPEHQTVRRHNSIIRMNLTQAGLYLLGFLKCHSLFMSKLGYLIIPPQTMFAGGDILFSHCPSVHLSVRSSVSFSFFFNILKRQ